MSKSALFVLAAASLAIPGAASAQYVTPVYGQSVYTGYNGGGYQGGGYYGGGYQGGGYQAQYPGYGYQGGSYGYDTSIDGYNNCRRDNGLGGAAIGAVVGGVAGNRIAGKGSRLEGTLIGGGLGALAGMAIDKAEDDPCYNYMPASYRDEYYGRVPNGYGPHNSTGGYYGAQYPAPDRRRDQRGGDRYAYGYGGPYGQGQAQGNGWQSQSQQQSGYYQQGYSYPRGYVPSAPPAPGYGYGNAAGYWVYSGSSAPTSTTVVVNAASGTTTVTEEVVEYSSGGDYYYDEGAYYDQGAPQARRRQTKNREYHTKGK